MSFGSSSRDDVAKVLLCVHLGGGAPHALANSRIGADDASRRQSRVPIQPRLPGPRKLLPGGLHDAAALSILRLRWKPREDGPRHHRRPRSVPAQQLSGAWGPRPARRSRRPSNPAPRPPFPTVAASPSGYTGARPLQGQQQCWKSVPVRPAHRQQDGHAPGPALRHGAVPAPRSLPTAAAPSPVDSIAFPYCRAPSQTCPRQARRQRGPASPTRARCQPSPRKHRALPGPRPAAPSRRAQSKTSTSHCRAP